MELKECIKQLEKEKRELDEKGRTVLVEVRRQLEVDIAKIPPELLEGHALNIISVGYRSEYDGALAYSQVPVGDTKPCFYVGVEIRGCPDNKMYEDANRFLQKIESTIKVLAENYGCKGNVVIFKPDVSE